MKLKLKMLKQAIYMIQYEVEGSEVAWTFCSLSKKAVKEVAETARTNWKLYKLGPLKIPRRRMLLTEIIWKLALKYKR